ncbi:hypothetical protein SETIT_4G045000v2 [Setaria italica]|uniref:Uncharacterized protein n=1 Tax=Setaria italica TaxID=4555 RepID=A0A368QRB8_SETIT|nr:hypothetical protein SETIT_4G045000v2 [Setaria italica]
MRRWAASCRLQQADEARRPRQHITSHRVPDVLRRWLGFVGRCIADLGQYYNVDGDILFFLHVDDECFSPCTMLCEAARTQDSCQLMESLGNSPHGTEPLKRTGARETLFFIVTCSQEY